MAGGTFSTYDKIRPGAYVNTVSERKNVIEDSRGIVLLMNSANFGWGKNGVITLSQDDDIKKILGVDLKSKEATTIRQAFEGGSLYVKLINFNMGTKATASDKAFPYEFTAKYNGLRGNNITIDFVQNIADTSKAIVKTMFGTEIVDVQNISIDHPEQLRSNDYIDINFTSGKLDLQGERTVQLSGGTSQDASKIDVMSEALSRAVQSEQYNVATTAGIPADNKIHQLLAQMISDLRTNQGMKVTAVVPYSGIDYDSEAVSVVQNGVIEADGTAIDNSSICAWFAGQSASVPLNRSLTYAVYEGASNAYPSLTQDEIIKALKSGRIVFTNRRNGNVVVEQDINSLVTFTDNKSSQFHKNRELRALDAITNHIEEMFEEGYIGSITNNENGRTLLKSSVIAYFGKLVDDGIIGDFNPKEIIVEKGNADDTVLMQYAITPVDSMEKLYNTIKVTR